MKRQRVNRIIIVGAISILIALSSIGVFATNKSPIARLLIRDAVVATVAHHKAGEAISVDIEYGEFTNESTYSNSLWALNYSQIIAPFFEQENIREIPVYPKEIIIELKEALKEFYVSGIAYYEDGNIFIFLYGEEQIDSRRLLPVLVHEQIHLQGGQFIGTWNILVFEGNTQAATTEVLAAMCYSGDNLACTAFWKEIESYTSGTFWTHLQQTGLTRWYQVIATLLWSGGTNFRDVSVAGTYAYLYYPWNRVIVPGVMGKSLNTGNVYEYEISNRNFVCKELLMSFDDTEGLFGWLDQFIGWITPDSD